MTVSVLVPWLPDGGHRDAAWAWCARQWDGYEVITGAPAGGPWVKAAAVADALGRAAGDVLVVADADVYVPGVRAAVEAVGAGAGWAVPHRLVHRLNQASTAEVLGGGPVGGSLEQRPYLGVAGGGCVVLARAAYEACPLDPRFVGWGQEDQSWGIALATMCGLPWRSDEPLWHLWHPPQPRMSRSTGSLAGRALAGRYQAAADDRASMADLLGEIGTTTMESHMYRYRNVNTGDEVEFPSPRHRLEALSNWVRISGPDPGAPPEPAPVPAPVVPDVQGPDNDLYRPPKPYAGKAEWLAYARWRQVAGCDGMSKAQLVEACG